MAGAKHKPIADKPALALPAVPLPFVITCTCGQVHQGTRGEAHQVLSCTPCGRSLFVLPASPWPASESELARLTVVRLAGSKAPPGKASASRSAWLQPVVAGLATLALLASGFVVFWSLLPQKRPTSRSAEVRRQAAAARDAIRQRNFGHALATLDALRPDLEHPPGDLSSAEVQQLLQLHRQVDLVAGLLSIPLEELLVEAHQLPTERWASRFASSFAGRGVVFDALIEHDNDLGDSRLDYVLEAQRIPGRIALSDFQRARSLFRSAEPRRWVSGGKLASMRMEADARKPPGQWVVRFAPTSLVLLTEPAILQALGLAEDREWPEILDRQQRLLTSSQRVGLLTSVQLPKAPDGIRKEYGPPDRISRQVLGGRLVEQWIYTRNPPFRINLEIRPGTPPRLAPLGPPPPLPPAEKL
jgi:hypothetical protein